MSSFATFSSFRRCSFHQAALTERTSMCTDCRDLPGTRSGRGLGLRILPTEGIPVSFSIRSRRKSRFSPILQNECLKAAGNGLETGWSFLLVRRVNSNPFSGQNGTEYPSITLWRSQ